MSLAIRNKLVELLNTIPQIGRVHSYQRYATDNGSLQKHYLFQRTDGINELRGWYVTRARQSETREALAQTWHVVGFLTWNDAGQSELLFADLVDAIVQLFRDKYDLEGVVQTTETTTARGIQIDEEVPVMFCGVLCHHARLSITVIGDAELSVPSNLTDFVTFHGEYDMAPQDTLIDAIDDVELEQ